MARQQKTSSVSTEVRESIRRVDPQIERVSKALMDMQDIESYQTDSYGATDCLLMFQDQIAEAQEALEIARKEMAIYLVLDRGVSRERVANKSRVNGVTIGRWVKALENKREEKK